MVQEPTCPSISIKHISPSTRGKGKLDTSIDQRVIQLEEKLQEYEILDIYLKEENVLLKERVAKLDKQVIEGQGKQAFLAKCVMKWYDEFQVAKFKVQVLKAKLAKV